jgi:Flp pilus assembly protein TadB
MALSDSEQRRLDEIERALADEDPRRLTHVSIDPGRRRRRLVGACVLLVGTLVLLVGLVLTAVTLIVGVVISIVGVGICVTAVLYAELHRS